MGRTVQLGADSGVTPGQIFHYTGYAIQIQQVGAGGTAGLQTDEGTQLPIGTVYVITSGAGAGEIWQATGPNTATQRVDLQQAAATGGGSSGAAVSSAAVAAPASWFSSSTDLSSVGLGSVPNSYLAIGGIVLGILILGKKR